MAVAEETIASFHRLALDACQREALELESLREGAGSHRNFAGLDQFWEEWFTLIIFKEIYRRRVSAYSLEPKPSVIGEPGARTSGKLDLRLTNAAGDRADFELKGWWPPSQTAGLVRVMKRHVEDMNRYPKNHSLFLFVYAHCAVTDGDLKTLVANMADELNGWLESRALGFSWTPNCDENESEITRRWV